tara:strand:+ start:965 stop:1303 length:339 start_codon:yes stop_codon:yes gene_type:complete
MRDFVAVTEDGNIRLATKARCARRAALKIATAGDPVAYVLDPLLNKLHCYSCGTRELKEEEKTSFTASHRILHKPVAQKTGYTPVSRTVSYDALCWETPQREAVAEALRRIA